MCLAVPAEVVDILDGNRAVIDVGGARNEVSLALVEGVSVGDYVIVHVGFAIARLNVAEAEQSLALFREIADFLEESEHAVRH